MEKVSNHIASGDNPDKKLDQKWYERLEKLGSFQTYEYLNGDKARRMVEKKAFLESNDSNPDLDYPKIDLDALKQVDANLMTMKQDLLSQEENLNIRQLYRWKLNEKLAEVRMLQAVANKDSRRFYRYSRFIYGEPSADIFAFTISNIRSKIQAFLEKDNNIESLKLAAKDLLESLPEVNNERSDDDLGLTLPSEEVFSVVGRESIQLLNSLQANSNEHPSSQKITPAEIQNVFEKALSNLPNSDDWSVIIDDSSRSAISVDQENKTLNIPNKEYTYSKIISLIVHEIGTHISRRINGERSKLMLLGLGLDRYEPGEEGIATMREQGLKTKLNDFSGLTGHLAISLARGLDVSPRDFRQTYTILEKYFYFNALKSKKYANSPKKAKERAQELAWNRTVRTFRGTDCKTPGMCFTKDIIYREGNIGIWNLIKNNPEELVNFNIGKYDPTNNRHLVILTRLGITDGDLKQLKE